jgi:hypothetical protein
MKPVSMRTQLQWVIAAYAAVVIASALLVVERYLQYVRHPEDANLYSGMWAGGDMLLGTFIAFLLLVPTFFLVLVIRKSEDLYTGYAKVLLGIGISAPVSLGLMAIPVVGQSNMLLGWVCLWRIMGSPFILAGMGGSRLLARYPRAKRLCSYALLIEGLTLAVLVAFLVLPLRGHRAG